ncbi:MAG: nucleoside monophosphate kinase [Clostridiales bacterium]|nr:nucleoside monophosphate kinase [Clostridiales bacterium]
MNVILLGPPGSGKGTQGALLADQLQAWPLSTGDLFREILKDSSHPLYSQVQVIQQGVLVSDDVVNQVVEQGIAKPEYKNGVLFDGYPRTIAQAEVLDRILADIGCKVDLIIDLDVTKEVLFYRILGRMLCSNCKKIYHESQGLSHCTDCGGDLIRRSDDNEETIVQRLQEYRTKTEPLVDHYRKSKATFIAVTIDDHTLSSQEVNLQIVNQLKENNII